VFGKKPKVAILIAERALKPVASLYEEKSNESGYLEVLESVLGSGFCL
jgi:hypothetical protein